MNTVKRNYQAELDEYIKNIVSVGITPSLTLHSCCAPCSSYVLEYLSEYFKIDVVYYNPNISSKDEFELRLSEQKRLVNEMKFKNPVTVIACDYNPKEFYGIAKGLEKCPERGQRCLACYKLRLEYTAKLAKESGSDCFATTLTLSPLKNAEAINSIGEEISAVHNVKYLCSDFKKRNGYKRSIELSKEYELYRQNFCGCIYSKFAEED
ncbi:MAG: epoxyqueuosine reductase QueH [Ruminococcus sp.]